jgi:hypothetical protein
MTRHSPDTEAERLLALSEKVGRVAQSLAELALERDSHERVGPNTNSEISAETVDWLIQARRARTRCLPSALLGEPVWDLMLHLLHAEITDEAVSVSAACQATGLPEEVGRRWLNAVLQNGLANVHKSSGSAEEKVQLSPQASSALRSYFLEIVEPR